MPRTATLRPSESLYLDASCHATRLELDEPHEPTMANNTSILSVFKHAAGPQVVDSASKCCLELPQCQCPCEDLQASDVQGP